MEATTLDYFFGPDESESCALWIDVEGASGDVLTGRADTLKKASVAFIEVEDERYWGDDCWLMTKVAPCFYDAGLGSVARDDQSSRQYNVMFVREELLKHHAFRLALVNYRSTIPQAIAAPSGFNKLQRKVRKLSEAPERFVNEFRHPILRRFGKVFWGSEKSKG